MYEAGLPPTIRWVSTLPRSAARTNKLCRHLESTRTRVDDADYVPIFAGGFAPSRECCFLDFGNNVEDRLGHVKYLIFYLACGVLASLTQWFFSQTSGIPSLGASGAIAGVMGAYILRFPRAEILTFL